jgi:hypothetical protein
MPEPEKKADDVNAETNAKIAELVKVIQDQNKQTDNSAADATAAAAAAVKAEELAKIKEAADIKALLTDIEGEGDDKYADLTPKEILDIVADAFETSIDAKTKLAIADNAGPMEELNKKMDSIQQYLVQKEAQTGVQEARQKFSDFDEFKDDMEAVWERYPGISVDDAYVLAKGLKAGKLPPKGVVDSEKPVSLGTRQRDADETYRKRDKDKKGGLGQRGMKAAFGAAADRVIGNRQQ